MKIAITGSAGFVGKNAFRVLSDEHEVYGISRRESETTTHRQDIAQPGIERVLNEINPNVIVHSAAMTWMDRCEVHREEAERINVTGTKNLVDWAAKKGRKVVFISSEAVYPGETNNYGENSKTRPVNYYGETKLRAEGHVSRLESYSILRPTCIFGYDPEGKNFLMQLLTAKEEKKVARDQVSNPTDVRVLVDYIERVLEKDVRGLFVATGIETMSRMDFAELAIDVFSLDKSLFIPATTAELGRAAKVPLNNGTNASKITRVLGYECPTIRESLVRIKEENNL